LVLLPIDAIESVYGSCKLLADGLADEPVGMNYKILSRGPYFIFPSSNLEYLAPADGYNLLWEPEKLLVPVARNESLHDTRLGPYERKVPSSFELVFAGRDIRDV